MLKPDCMTAFCFDVGLFGPDWGLERDLKLSDFVTAYRYAKVVFPLFTEFRVAQMVRV